MSVAIITGASAGMGSEFARQLDRDDAVDQIWLIARRRQRLEELATTLTSDTRVFPTDLTDPEDLAQLYDALAKGPQISWLVNNAGFGKIGRFDAVPAATNLTMIDLNVRALTELTQRCLPHLESGSRIVQVASTAGRMPVTNFGVYAATKAYVIHFANALSQELKARNIAVTAVCPGPVATEFFEVATVAGSEVEKPGFLMAPADKVVAKALRDARRGRRCSVYGLLPKLAFYLAPLMPRSLVLAISEKMYS